MKGEGTGIPNKSWLYMAFLYKHILYWISVSEQDYLDLGNRNYATKQLRKSANKASTLYLTFGIFYTFKAMCPVIGCVREKW